MPPPSRPEASFVRLARVRKDGRPGETHGVHRAPAMCANVGSSGSHAVARKCLLWRRRCSGGRSFGRSCCCGLLICSSRVTSFMSAVASLVASRPPRLASVHSVRSGCLSGRGGGCGGIATTATLIGRARCYARRDHGYRCRRLCAPHRTPCSTTISPSYRAPDYCKEPLGRAGVDRYCSLMGQGRKPLRDIDAFGLPWFSACSFGT